MARIEIVSPNPRTKLSNFLGGEARQGPDQRDHLLESPDIANVTQDRRDTMDASGDWRNSPALCSKSDNFGAQF
jgi:hypothetical protein